MGVAGSTYFLTLADNLPRIATPPTSLSNETMTLPHPHEPSLRDLPPSSPDIFLADASVACAASKPAPSARPATQLAGVLALHQTRLAPFQSHEMPGPSLLNYLDATYFICLHTDPQVCDLQFAVARSFITR